MIKHTDQGKRWNRPKKLPYKLESIEPRQTILIVCEGENTEPEYFKAFPIDKTKAFVDVRGKGSSRTRLVEDTIQIRSKDFKGVTELQVWCVFDMDVKHDDATRKEDFNRAVEIAENEEFEVAYSNDLFELWFVLHYDNITGSKLVRGHYYDRLSEYWGCNYKKEGKRASILPKHLPAIAKQTSQRSRSYPTG